MSTPNDESQAWRRTIHHPLRGLASVGAHEAVSEALHDLDGILSVRLTHAHSIAEITFDSRLVTLVRVRERLLGAGVTQDTHRTEHS